MVCVEHQARVNSDESAQSEIRHFVCTGQKLQQSLTVVTEDDAVSESDTAEKQTSTFKARRLPQQKKRNSKLKTNASMVVALLSQQTRGLTTNQFLLPDGRIDLKSFTLDLCLKWLRLR